VRLRRWRLARGENDRLVGMVTELDIAVCAVAENKSTSTKVRDVMSGEVRFCYEDEDAGHVAKRLKRLSRWRASLNPGVSIPNRRPEQEAAMAEARKLTDHDDIRRWIEHRGGRPARVKATAEDSGIPTRRIPRADQGLEELS
jgi:CBS domain-containing protein